LDADAHLLARPHDQTAMKQLENTQESYGAAAIAVHWVMAALLITLIVLGLYMVELPDVGFDTRKIVLILCHKELGILALALAALRLAWRLGNVLPGLVETLPGWQKVAARFVHLCFYALMFALPVTGWLMSSATGIPVTFLGLCPLPDLISYDEHLFRTLIEIHKWLGYTLMVFILAHIGAALEHHFALQDATLKKMLPGSHL
jgi:cytochrome b561